LKKGAHRRCAPGWEQGSRLDGGSGDRRLGAGILNGGRGRGGAPLRLAQGLDAELGELRVADAEAGFGGGADLHGGFLVADDRGLQILGGASALGVVEVLAALGILDSFQHRFELTPLGGDIGQDALVLLHGDQQTLGVGDGISVRIDSWHG